MSFSRSIQTEKWLNADFGFGLARIGLGWVDLGAFSNIRLRLYEWEMARI